MKFNRAKNKLKYLNSLINQKTAFEGYQFYLNKKILDNYRSITTNDISTKLPKDANNYLVINVKKFNFAVLTKEQSRKSVALAVNKYIWGNSLCAMAADADFRSEMKVPAENEIIIEAIRHDIGQTCTFKPNGKVDEEFSGYEQVEDLDESIILNGKSVGKFLQSVDEVNINDPHAFDKYSGAKKRRIAWFEKFDKLTGNGMQNSISLLKQMHPSSHHASLLFLEYGFNRIANSIVDRNFYLTFKKAMNPGFKSYFEQKTLYLTPRFIGKKFLQNIISNNENLNMKKIHFMENYNGKVSNLPRWNKKYSFPTLSSNNLIDHYYIPDFFAALSDPNVLIRKVQSVSGININYEGPNQESIMPRVILEKIPKISFDMPEWQIFQKIFSKSMYLGISTLESLSSISNTRWEYISKALNYFKALRRVETRDSENSPEGYSYDDETVLAHINLLIKMTKPFKNMMQISNNENNIKRDISEMLFLDNFAIRKIKHFFNEPTHGCTVFIPDIVAEKLENIISIKYRHIINFF
ncbi:MAG: hypothetical protein ACTSVU_08560 [Promethearchaeota archaeon]